MRTTVNEKLDRHVPISNQPEEKILEIIDLCTEQFPEFVGRARKRIRTYLKTCRKLKRKREDDGLEGSAPRVTSVKILSLNNKMNMHVQSKSNNF